MNIAHTQIIARGKAVITATGVFAMNFNSGKQTPVFSMYRQYVMAT